MSRRPPRRALPPLAGAGIALALGGTGIGSHEPSLQRPVSYRTGTSLAGVVVRDVNSDGRQDLVTAREYDYPARGGAVSVLLNRGGGAFAPKGDYPTGDPDSLAVGDVNGDRRPDVVTGDNGSDVSVLLGTVNGFAAAVQYAAGFGSDAHDVALADVDGDGKLDVVVANAEDNTVSVLANRGDGTFAAHRDYPAGAYPRRVAVADLNGDRWADIVTADTDGNAICVLLNRGRGVFGTRRCYRLGTASAVAIHDVDRDGKPDIVGTDDEDDLVAVFLNGGDGHFVRPHAYATGAGPDSVTVGDLNGDGLPDLAVGDWFARPAAAPYPSSVSVFANDGHGRFRRRIAVRAGASLNAVALGYLDRDRRLDLVTRNAGVGRVQVFLNRPGLCTVQGLKGLGLAAARRLLEHASCRLGKVAGRRGPGARVLSQRPVFGAVLPGGSRVSVVVG